MSLARIESTVDKSFGFRINFQSLVMKISLLQNLTLNPRCLCVHQYCPLKSLRISCLHSLFFTIIYNNLRFKSNILYEPLRPVIILHFPVTFTNIDHVLNNLKVKIIDRVYCNGYALRITHFLQLTATFYSLVDIINYACQCVCLSMSCPSCWLTILWSVIFSGISGMPCSFSRFTSMSVNKRVAS